jgi:hypothetical protein
MVDVHWDLRGGALDRETANKAVGRVLSFYQQALEGSTCPIHDREPWLKVQGATVQSLVVSIEACCEESLERAKTRVGGVSRRSQE